MMDEMKNLINEGYTVDEIAEMISEGDEEIKRGLIVEVETLADAVDDADRKDEDED